MIGITTIIYLITKINATGQPQSQNFKFKYCMVNYIVCPVHTQSSLRVAFFRIASHIFGTNKII